MFIAYKPNMMQICVIFVLILNVSLHFAEEDSLLCDDTEEGFPTVLRVTWKPKLIVNARLLINLDNKLVALCESNQMKCIKILDNAEAEIVQIDYEEYNITVFTYNINSSGTWTIEYDYGLFKPAPEPCKFNIYSKSFLELKDCPTEIEERNMVNCSCELKSSMPKKVVYNWLSIINSSLQVMSNTSDLTFAADKLLQDFLCVAEDLQAERNYTKDYSITIKSKRYISLTRCPTTILDQLQLLNCSYIYRSVTSYFENVCDVSYSVSDNTYRLTFVSTECSLELMCPVETSMRNRLTQVCSRATCKYKQRYHKYIEIMKYT
ncbi:uncharacterized protein LOC129922778 isoform X2 [Biomphalaria glabrata]|uniref:Uncharacterized protein LOC129922778 isoform X2 n=1 Tax=Biomphalaria glabrata TaxID=6526 RepID=A0A9W2YT08_BIOGL|nr:uncharacterized protein LOC129922778 isoform X2 [Biomphalaria glabrata]